MNSPRRKGPWVVTILILFAAVVATWSIVGRGRPLIKLLSVSEVNGERVARMEVSHDPEEIVLYFPNVFVRNHRGRCEKIGATWPGKDASSGIIFRDPVQKSELFTLQLPGGFKYEPFEVGVEFLETPSGVWQFPPLRWLSEPRVRSRVTWSEAITP